jgi:hypothetical protein
MPRLPVMHRLLAVRGIVAVAVAVMLIGGGGCGGKGAKKAKKAGGTKTQEPGPPPVDSDTAFTVDDGRVSVSSPTGWARAPRSDDYLVKYQPNRKKTFPAIAVTAHDAPEGFSQVTSENHDAFTAAITDSLADAFEAKASGPLVKKPGAVSLGPHCGVAWALPLQTEENGVKETNEQQFYAVVIDGRMYTVTASAPKGKLDSAAKAAARAVAGALTAPEATPAVETPAAETPAE